MEKWKVSSCFLDLAVRRFGLGSESSERDLEAIRKD
jgi:hypothetical protein